MNQTMTKRDRGAIVFQGFFNRLREDSERMDANQLKVMRALGEMKRRLDTLEEAVKLHGQVIFEEEPRIRFACISCDRSFDLPLPTAQAQNFVSICSTCHNWSLPMLGKEERQYSPKEIATLTGFNHSTVCKTIRELGLKDGRRHQLYGEEDLQEIKAVLQTKIPGRGGHRTRTRHQ